MQRCNDLGGSTLWLEGGERPKKEGIRRAAPMSADDPHRRGEKRAVCRQQDKWCEVARATSPLVEHKDIAGWIHRSLRGGGGSLMPLTKNGEREEHHEK